MKYNALKHVQNRNLELYNIPYPALPEDITKRKNISCIEKECLEFIQDSCADLRFDPARSAMDDTTGRSLAPGQIPFNMEMDLDRLCLVNAIHRFMKSGVAQDALDVYFCYLEMFVGAYGHSKKMIELLAEFESNASSLLMKHRDHYSHSVYVFILGMAIFNRNRIIREAFRKHYGLSGEQETAHTFIKYWGLTALFHDIGYPFELPFEQIKSYFNGKTTCVPYVRYDGLDAYLPFSAEEASALGHQNINDLLAENIAGKLHGVYGGSLTREEYTKNLRDTLDNRPTKPGEYMDHAYFSAVVLLKQLLFLLGPNGVDSGHIDALTAITLHNSLFKHSIRQKKVPGLSKPLSPELHPLAYLLMLCDELQCWDRTSYGQNSRRELHAMWCDLEFEENTISAHYYYDQSFARKKSCAEGSYQKMTGREHPNAPVHFLKDIQEIVAVNQPDTPRLELEVSFIKNNRETRTYASSSSFLHLYNFAVALNARYFSIDPTAQNAQEIMESAFDQLSLEYKLSNIMQAKAFAEYLDKIGCFYTDKPVAYEVMDRFSDANMDIIGPLEHDRWLREKKSMAWTLHDAYDDRAYLLQRGIPESLLRQKSKQLRELTRTHKLMIEDYNELDPAEQAKDTEPMNRMLELISEYDGLRIYRL